MKKIHIGIFAILIAFNLLFSAFAISSDSSISVEVVNGGSSSSSSGSGGGGGSSSGGSSGGEGASGTVEIHYPDIDYIYGDVNFDGKSDQEDAKQVMLYKAGLIEFNPIELIMADVNLDGSVTESDAMWILRFAENLQIKSSVKTGYQFNKRTITKIQAKDGYFTNDVLYYYQTSSDVDSKATGVKLSDNLKHFINSYEPDTSFETLYNNTQFIYLDLVDYNNDNIYDYAFVTAYDSLCVESVDLEIKEIIASGKTSSAPDILILDPSDEQNRFVLLNQEEHSIRFEDIKKGDILNIFSAIKPDGTVFKKIIVTSYQITGMIEEEVYGAEYKLGETYYSSCADVNVGDQGKFYIDMFGVILKFEEDHSDKKFGMVYAAYVDSNGLDNEPRVMIYTTQGEFITYQFFKSVYINNNYHSRDNLINSGSIDTTVFTPAAGDLVMYITNSSGAISEIYTSSYIAEKSNGYFNLKEYSENTTFRESNMKLGSLYINESSKLIANQRLIESEFNKEDLSMISPSLLNENDVYSYQAIADCENNIVFAVIYDFMIEVDNSSPVMFVTGTSATLDSTGSSAVLLTGTVNNETVSVVVTVNTNILDVEDNPYFENFHKGDMIQYIGEDEAAAVRVILTADQIANYSNETEGLNIQYEDNNKEGFIYGGKVSGINNNWISFTDGNELYCSLDAPVMLVRTGNSGVDKAYTSNVSLLMAETDVDCHENNDDIVIIYKYDWEPLGVIIVDADGDTGYHITDSPASVDGTLKITNKQAKDGTIDINNQDLLYYETNSDVNLSPVRVSLSNDFQIYKNSDTVPFNLNDFAYNYQNGNFTELILTDKNNDYIYDEARLIEYYAIRVGEIIPSAYKIISNGKTGGAPSALYLNPEDQYVLENKDGTALQFSDIKKDDILNVFESEATDGTISREIIITQNQIEGTVSELTDTEQFKIGNSYYDSYVSINVGDKGIFYIDMFGCILKFEEDHSNKKFGMVYAAYVDSNGVDNEPTVMIYTIEGEFATYQFQKNVQVNEMNYKKSDFVEFNNNINTSIFTPVAGDLVMYTTNSSGAISGIYTSNYISTESDGKYQLKEYSENNHFSKSSMKLGSLSLTENSKLVANRSANGTTFHKDDLSLISFSMLNEDDDFSFRAIADKENNIVLAFLYELYIQADRASPIMFVTSVGTTFDSSGYPATALTGIMNEETTKIIITEYTMIEDVMGGRNEIHSFNKGDMIQYKGSGEVAAVRVILTADQIVNYSNESYGLNINDEDNDDEGFIYGGKAVSIAGGLIEFEGMTIGCRRTVPTMLIRPLRIYTVDISVDLAETDRYDDDNDDIVIVYKFDDEALGAIIVDQYSDTRIN